MLGALRGQRFTSINELEKALSELTKEAKREKPRVFVDCLAEKGEGKVSILIENPAPLPMEAVITLEGAVPLKPAMRLRVYPRSTASWESRVLVHEQRVTARVTYKVAGVGAEGVVTVEGTSSGGDRPTALPDLFKQAHRLFNKTPGTGEIH